MILVLGPLRGLTMRVEGVGWFPATLYQQVFNEVTGDPKAYYDDLFEASS